jgi:glycosyltransferase involved in cell wall biosynthesis
MAARVPPVALSAALMPEVVVMVTTSYPRFPGDSVGTFMEPIAASVAARGHEVHVVAPWHPLVTRQPEERGVRFHFYKYAPVPALNVFGYAAALRADVSLRGAAYVAAPLALAAGWLAAFRVARRHHATVMHGHWVIPGGFTALAAAPRRPQVVSLHGSDVYVAETFAPARRAARLVFKRAGAITACSADLAQRAIGLGADPAKLEVVPYGVDTDRFRPQPERRAALRAKLGVGGGSLLAFSAGRLVRKKGFEHLIDAWAQLREAPAAILAIAGDGDLRDELHARARAAGVAERVRFLGNLSQDDVGAYLAAADVVVIPSVKDDSGNVDGLPNVVLEALAAGAAVIATAAGGIGTVVEHEKTGLVVPERNAAAIAAAVARTTADPELRARLGEAARRMVETRFGWGRAAERFEAAYRRALANKTVGR